MIKDEKIILNQLHQDSTEALQQLHKIYAEIVYRVCRKFFLSHEDAQEVVQDVFLKIWTVRKNIKPDLSFKAYLLKIGRNIIIKKLQKRVLKVTIDHYLDHRSFAENSIEDLVNYKETASLVDKIINELPPQKQKIFLLNRYEDKSVENIAAELGLSKRTVENHIYQTRSLLKSKLDSNAVVPLFIALQSILSV